MAQTYFTGVRIGSDEAIPVSTLYGVCGNTATNPNKTVSIPAFDGVEENVSIQVCFLMGNSLTNGITLTVSNTLSYPVHGNMVCDENEVITFVFNHDVNSNAANWRVVGHSARPSDDLPENVGAVASAGISSRYARADHTHAVNLQVEPGQNPGEIVIGGQTVSVPGFGTLTDDFIPKNILTQPYDLIFAAATNTPARLPGNLTTTRKFLRMVGIETYNSGDGTTEIVGTTPIWDTVTATDIGLDQVSNHLQVHGLNYNANNGAVTYAIGDDTLELFRLGSNAFLSTEFLPLNGGKMTGQLSFNENAMALLWDNATALQRIIVNSDRIINTPVFTFQQNIDDTWITLMEISDAGEVTANTFVGNLTGTADSATNLEHKQLNANTLNNQSDSFAFSGNGDPWVGENWTGLQIGDNHIKFQIVDANNELFFRSNKNNTWTQWAALITESNVSSGDNNGQIKVGSTNINVTGLGALAYKDTINEEDLGDIADYYVTLTTEQTITGNKIFNTIAFVTPTAAEETHGITFNGTTQGAELYYVEPTLNNDGRLRLILSNTAATPFEIGWDTGTEAIVHSFTATEYVLSPAQVNGNIAIRPGTTNRGTVGTQDYAWGAMYATDFYGNLHGTADTASRAAADSDGVAINTGYLKLSGGTMTGTLTTRMPINQILTDGRLISAVSDESSLPERWLFTTNITPANGDIITIQTPGDGHDNGIMLSLDNGTTYHPVSLNGSDRLVDEYPANSILTLVYDNANVVHNVYPITGATTRTSVTGTWRVINYYDSGAPYGVRVYKDQTANVDLPLLISRYRYIDLLEDYTNNVYGTVNVDSTKVPTYNSATGTLKAPRFEGVFSGSVDTAVEFYIPTTVTLTGDVTGVSDPSTRGWTVDTTIADSSVSNSMLVGGITRAKLENGVVKVFTQTETEDILDFDDITINGFFPLRASSSMPVSQGIRPLTSAAVFLNLVTPDSQGYLQLAGVNSDWLIRGNVGDDLTSVEWRHLVVENVTGQTNRPWRISIDGVAAYADADGNGNVFSEYYATKQQLNNILGMSDALVFKGFVDNHLLVDNEQRRTYRNLPNAGYSAGWTYKVEYDGIYAGQICERGDLIIAINDSANNSAMVVAEDWVVVQANLEAAISGTGYAVEPYSFAVYNSASGRTVTDTGQYLVSLQHVENVTGVEEVVGSLDGFTIKGRTYSLATELVSGVATRLAYGDSGPQIRFQDNQIALNGQGSILNSAIIFSGYSSIDNIQTTFHFVTQGGETAIRTDAMLLHHKAVIGSNIPNENALLVNGATQLNGQLKIADGANSMTILNENNSWKFLTAGASNQRYIFGATVQTNGNIVPSVNRQFFLGEDGDSPKHWAKLYVGEFASYGSTVQPVYWNDGAPSPVVYDPYRIHYAYTENGNLYYGFANHYIDANRLSVGSTSAPGEGYSLYVNGGAFISGQFSLNSNVLPSGSGLTLGNAEQHWARLYIGEEEGNSGADYGDEWTPIYWRNGVPTPATSLAQRKDFTFSSGAREVRLANQNAYTANTIVIELAITNGRENLRAPITWTAGEHIVILNTAVAPVGPVEGYIVTMRGTVLN